MSKNPFLQSAKLTVYIKENKYHVLNTENNEPNTVRGQFVSQQEFEKDPFVKIYNERPFFNIFKQITDTASKMFLYITYTLPKNTDIIQLNADTVMNFVGIKSVTTYYKYIQELIDNAIITRKNNSEYWINPLFLFNGNRVDYYKEFCPECIEVINITEIQESRTIRKKKELMNYFRCKNYYQLKKLLGEEQISLLLKKELQLNEVKLLN